MTAYIWGSCGPTLTRLMVLRSQRPPDNLSTGFHFTPGHLVTLGLIGGMAPSRIFLMTLQEPADHRDGQRGRCAPFETYDRDHYFLWTLFVGLEPTSFQSLYSDIARQTGWSTGNRCPHPLPILVARTRAHESQPGCGRGLAGRLVTALNRQKHRQMATLATALTSSLKELIIDFLARLSNFLMIAFLRAVNWTKTAPNSTPQRRNQSWC